MFFLAYWWQNAGIYRAWTDVQCASHLWSTVQRKRSWFEHMQNMIPKSRKLDSFLHEAAQNFKYSIFNKKIKKTFSGLCPFQGLSSGTTLMRIQSGRTVPLKEPVYLSVVGGPSEEESVKVQAELTDVTRNSNFILTRRLTHTNTKPNF